MSSASAVLVVDDLSTGKRANLQHATSVGAELVSLDVRDAVGLRKVFVGFQPDIVFHLAAQMDVRISMVETARDAEINIIGSINVYSAALACGAPRVVNTSTGGAIYGDYPTIIPTPETEPTVPLSAYGLSKRTAEHYADWYRRTHNLDIVTLRYGNVYGPRQDPAGDAGVVAIFCSRLLAGRRPIVFGSGEQTRDYTFVDDIVAANLAASRSRDLKHAVYNVGTGREVSVLELAEAIAKAAGREPATFAPEMRPARAGEVHRNCLDVSRARCDLELATPTPLEHGLRQTLGWLRRELPKPQLENV
jgi:UDP-glucose 4-epimerase